MIDKISHEVITKLPILVRYIIRVPHKSTTLKLRSQEKAGLRSQ